VRSRFRECKLADRCLIEGRALDASCRFKSIPSVHFDCAVASAVLLIRAIVFIHHEKSNIRPIYPRTWSAAQCRVLERFRLLVGLALIPLWGSFLCIAHWPLEFWDLFYFILLLLISSAWVRLLDQRNWEKSGANSRSFRKTIAILIVWWGVVFTATEYMFVPSILSILSDHQWRTVQMRYL
jgi:hypothetical protein